MLRFGIPYGPRARDATVLAAFTRKALAGESLTVAGSGDQTRRFVYVEDLADGVVRALDEPEAANRVYNLAGTETTTILEIAQAVTGPGRRRRDSPHARARRATSAARRSRASARWRSSAGSRPLRSARARGATSSGAWRASRPSPEPAAESPTARRRVLRGATAAWLAIPRRLRPVLSGALVSAAFFWSFASDDGLAVIAWAFPSAKPVDAVETQAPEVGLIVDAPSSQAVDVAEALSSDHASATIALTSSASNGDLAIVRGAGSDVMPRLRPGGPVRWIGTRGQLNKTARSLGLHGHFYYAAPGHGFTFAQEVLGKTTGATPVTGAVKLKPGDPRRHARARRPRGGLGRRWRRLANMALEPRRADAGAGPARAARDEHGARRARPALVPVSSIG